MHAAVEGHIGSNVLSKEHTRATLYIQNGSERKSIEKVTKMAQFYYKRSSQK